MRPNPDLDLFMGITPQTVTPNGPMPSPTPVPAEWLQDHRPSRAAEANGGPKPASRIPDRPKVGVLVSATAPKPVRPDGQTPDHRARVKATAIRLLYALRHLSPAERVEVLEAALKIERS